jgi:hypothetical protein
MILFGRPDQAGSIQGLHLATGCPRGMTGYKKKFGRNEAIDEYRATFCEIWPNSKILTVECIIAFVKPSEHV